MRTLLVIFGGMAVLLGGTTVIEFQESIRSSFGEKGQAELSATLESRSLID